jgi:tetratricopeptide (TPR) repeat protein
MYFNNNEELSYEKDRLLSRAWGYSFFDMHKEAIGECEELVRRDPSDASSYIELGRYLEDDGEVERAIECYKYVMKRFSDNFQAYLNLGYVFERHMKRNDMAMVCYEKALELSPSDEWALNNIGAILQKEGRWQEALGYYEKAYDAVRAHRGSNSQILHNLAWAYYRCKNHAKAMSSFIELINDDEYSKTNASVYYDCGCVSYRAGDYKRAFKLFEIAVSLSPANRYYRRSCQIAGKKI